MNEAAVSSPSPAPGSRVPPVERGYPLIGALPHILRDGPGFLTRVARSHPGEIVGVRLGPITAYLVTHPDHVQHVLLDHWRDFGKGGGMWRAIRPLLGNGLVTSEGDFWLRQRRLMQPLFSPDYLASLADVMTSVVEREVDQLARRTGTVVEMQREMGAITQRVLLGALFGSSIDRRETEHLGDQIVIAFREMNLRMFLYFLPDRIPLPGDRAFRRAIMTLDEGMMRLVRRRRGSGGEHHDLLSLLMHARDEAGAAGMDNRQLRDELVTLFVAGNDTTAKTMAWLWCALEQNPEVDRKLRAEVADVLGGRRPTHADLARLTYTKQVIQETMRLFPAAWFFPRFAAHDTTIGSFPIPAGSALVLNPFASHRDPAFWPDPERFDPGRFDPERAAARPRFAYYPFGGGPRQCIGNVFSLMEAQLITAMMVQRLRPRLVPGHGVAPSSATTLTVRHGLKMTLATAV
jgi:cytochrome P450